jgi:formate hydrogenlyase subunit 3/multisubunit Na+/H+ antiporter MnhD subunit
MNVVFLSHDLFNFFVALELLTFTAVPLVCLDGRGETLTAALRYLLFALLGSVLYLLGVGLLYGAYATLDLTLLAERIEAGPATWAAAALMTTGLLAKTAVVPLHLWLPPAHAGAPPAASTVLSALVVKGSFFILLRLWFEVLPGIAPAAGMQLLATLGAVAIVLGSAVALRQARLKLMIAYSTVAQIGYLMLVFALAFDAHSGLLPGMALTGALLQAISHALAKAAMFMTAGLMAGALGHDRIAEMAGVGRALPACLVAFVLAGVSLVGLPPSGGFLAKWLLLSSAISTGQWWWALVIVGGGLLTGTYVYIVVRSMAGGGPEPLELRKPIARYRQSVAVLLAACAALLGFVALGPIGLPVFDEATLIAGVLQ